MGSGVMVDIMTGETQRQYYIGLFVGGDVGWDVGDAVGIPVLKMKERNGISVIIEAT
jgi:hypothetical protein